VAVLQPYYRNPRDFSYENLPDALAAFQELNDPIEQLLALRYVILANEKTTNAVAKNFIAALPVGLQQGLGFNFHASIIGSAATSDCVHFIRILTQAKASGVYEETVSYLRKIAEFLVLINASDEISIGAALLRLNEVENPLLKLRMILYAVTNIDTANDVVRKFYGALPLSLQNGLKVHIWLAHCRDDQGKGIMGFGDHVIDTGMKGWIVRQAIVDYIKALVNAKKGVQTHYDPAKDDEYVQSILSRLPLISINEECLSVFDQIVSPLGKMTVFQALLNSMATSNLAIEQFHCALPIYLKEKFREHIKTAMGGEGPSNGFEELFIFTMDPHGPLPLKAAETLIAHLRTLPASG
jgi:hypothetical protein